MPAVQSGGRRIGQFLEAAALERALKGAEAAFWALMAELRTPAQSLATLPEKSDRTTELRKLLPATRLQPFGLPSAVGDGVWRDAMSAVSSFVELKAGGHPAEWPEPQAPVDEDYVQGLDDLAAARTREEENAARDRVFRLQRRQTPAP